MNKVKKLLNIIAIVMAASAAGLLIKNLDYIENMGRIFLSEFSSGEFGVKKSEIETIKQSMGLPLALNDTVVLTDIEFKEGDILYYYNLRGFDINEIYEAESELLKILYSNEVEKNLCASEIPNSPDWFHDGIPHKYKYHDQFGRQIFYFSISKEDC